jgi:hypothetical protein
VIGVSTLSGHEIICIVLCYTNKLDSKKFQGHFQFPHEHPSHTMEWSSPCLLCWIRDQVSPLAWAMLSTWCNGLERWDHIMTLRSGVADQAVPFHVHIQRQELISWLKLGRYKWHKHKTFFNYIDVYSSNFNSNTNNMKKWK